MTGPNWSPWQADARYHQSGMPANIAAVLHDQHSRMKRRRVVIGPYEWKFKS